MRIHPQLKNPKFYLMIVSDSIIFVITLILAYLVRFEFALSQTNINQILDTLLWIIPLKIIVFLFFGVYRGMWRYTSIRDFWILGQACLLSTLLIVAVILSTSGFQGFSSAIFIVDGALTFIFIGGKRMAIRSFFAIYANPKNIDNPFPKINFKEVLIVGAGAAGEKILREIFENYQLHYHVVGFIDDDPEKQGRSIHGVHVLGNVSRLPYILEKVDVEEILIAVPSANGDEIRHIVEACRACNVSYKILPGIGELIDGRVSIKILRDISYEDLLGRPPVHLNISGIRNYIDGKTVLITGCGGSIGSELCRQVLKYQPRSIILIDASEENLFNIHMELQNIRYCRNCVAILGQVQNKQLMEDVFKKYRPQVVFHAAAYKHVPMLEKNPWEAVFNNVVGSSIIIDMSVKYHVERFVLVSTDKAVRPTNVMGASKRIAELIMQTYRGNGTRLMAVRFGNVIGSSGSVMPIFHRQIEQGGPVTVTHPEVNRYFMTIPEASQMILQAGAMGDEGGEVFILRMGTPVKIADMARDLIRLSGKEPDVDIKIIYTGLREGEKLYEELITVGEDILPTVHEKVMVLRSNNHNGEANIQEMSKKLKKQIDELAKDAKRHNAASIKQKLKEMVPEYSPQENDSVL
jgi:FlaA1/EpsC-like NDP-sugar epimerase